MQGGCLVHVAVKDIVVLQRAGGLGPASLLLLDDKQVWLLRILQVILHPRWKRPA